MVETEPFPKAFLTSPIMTVQQRLSARKRTLLICAMEALESSETQMSDQVRWIQCRVASAQEIEIEQREPPVQLQKLTIVEISVRQTVLRGRDGACGALELPTKITPHSRKRNDRRASLGQTIEHS